MSGPRTWMIVLGLLSLTIIVLTPSCTRSPSSTATTPDQDTTGAARRADSLRAAAVADSLRDGYHIYRDPLGRPTLEGELVRGMRYGVWTSYRPSGRIQSRNVYDNGRLNGIATVFHENGVLYYTGTHRNGKPVGEWRFYDPQGNLAKTVTYDTAGTLINDHAETRPTR